VLRAKGAFFSFTEPVPPDKAADYFRWHALDHMVEQFQLSGIVHAQRWIADGALRDNQITADGRWTNLGSTMNYLVGDPAQQTIEDFMELGPRLREVGRLPYLPPSLGLRMLALLRWYSSPAALVSPEVVPWRPHRGVMLIVEEPTDPTAAVTQQLDAWLQWLHTDHVGPLLEVPGAAGAWMYGSTQTWKLPNGVVRDPVYITVVYLDQDPVRMTNTLAPLIEQRWASGAVRPLFAGPLRTMTKWDAWPE
jgi:hypothetical protein